MTTTSYTHSGYYIPPHDATAEMRAAIKARIADAVRRWAEPSAGTWFSTAPANKAGNPRYKAALEAAHQTLHQYHA